MANPLLVRKYVLLAKVETVYGSDASPTASDVILVENLKITPMFDLLDRKNVALPDLDKLPSLIGKFAWQVTFDCELRGSGGAATTPPDWGKLLRACSMSETIATEVTYTPESAGQESVTIYCYLDGLLHKMTGCVGTFEFKGEVGQPAKFSFEFRGKMSAMPADSANPTVTFQNTTPPLCLAAGFNYGSWDVPVTKFSFNVNNTLAPREDVRETYGYLGFFVSDRAPEGGFDPEVQTLASKDLWGDLVDRTPAALDITLGSGTGGTVEFAAPKCYLKDIGYADRNGILNYDARFECARNTGNDSFTIITS